MGAVLTQAPSRKAPTSQRAASGAAWKGKGMATSQRKRDEINGGGYTLHPAKHRAIGV